LNRAWREGHVASDAEWRRIEPYEDVDAARVRYLDVGEAQRLLNACGNSLRDLVHGALATGARYGELCGMDCADYDPRAGTVQIRQSKTGKARHVILNDEGAALFSRLTAGQPGDLPIFRKEHNQRWLRGHQARPFAEAVKRAKITPPISFHGLRHTYASLAIMAGMVPMVVAANLGHSDTRMVEKHYGHLADKFKTEMIRATAPVFGLEPDSVERLGTGR
jgi:integrase